MTKRPKAKTFKPVKMWAVAWRDSGEIMWGGWVFSRCEYARNAMKLAKWPMPERFKVVPVEVRRLR